MSYDVKYETHGINGKTIDEKVVHASGFKVENGMIIFDKFGSFVKAFNQEKVILIEER